MRDQHTAKARRLRRLRIIERIKLILALGMTAFLAYLFTFYLDADIGVVIMAFLIIAPLLSILLAEMAAKKVTAQIQVPDTVQKGRHFTASVVYTSDSRLPVPFIRQSLVTAANFIPDDTRSIQSAMTFQEPLEFQFGLTAAYAGLAAVDPAQARISDYLGLLDFQPKHLPETQYIGIIPAIPSLANAGIMLHSVSDAVLTQDEEEEETAALYSSQTMPGYIHRDYVPGDNLRRINWKLSAKRSKLMVRMDEAAATVRPTVVLDITAETEEKGLAERQLMMEGALGFLLLLVGQGIVCALRFRRGGGWITLPLDNEDAVHEAAIELGTSDLRGDENRIDPAVRTERAGAFMIFTNHPDAQLDAEMATLREEGAVFCIFPKTPEPPALAGADALWQLEEDFSFTAVRK